MASKTDIANLAGAAHQGAWLQDVDSDPGTMADALRAMWPVTLETALAMHPWKFALGSWKNQPPLPCEQNPDPEMPYAFLRPADCVRVFRLPPGFDFGEFGNIITAAAPCVTMVGVRRGVDIGLFSATFNDYLAALWAYRICTPVNASEAIRKRCHDEMVANLATARTDNGKVGTVRRPFADSFVLARLTGGPGIPA